MAIRVSLQGDQVVVRLTGFDQLFALKGRLDVPLSHVTSAQAMDRRTVPATPGTWLRAPGTHLPGLIRHGSYGTEPHREFWATYRQRRLLVVEVRDWGYHRLVLAVPDPDGVAAAIPAAST